MSTTISIITVSYNSERTIRKTIEAVLAQSYSPKEYIIVDGRSKDKTVSVAEEYADAFLEKGIAYRIVSEPDRGIYDAMNKGITMAQGDIIGMINSDDWYEKDALKTVAETYEKEQFDMMYADIILRKSNGTIIRKKARLRKYLTSRDWNHPTMFVKKEVYNHYQYDIGTLFADFDMLMKIRQNGYKVVVVNEVLANFMTGGVSNEKKFGSLINRIKDRYKTYRKNGYSRLYLFECLLIEMIKFIVA